MQNCRLNGLLYSFFPRILALHVALPFLISCLFLFLLLITLLFTEASCLFAMQLLAKPLCLIQMTIKTRFLCSSSPSSSSGQPKCKCHLPFIYVLLVYLILTNLSSNFLSQFLNCLLIRPRPLRKDLDFSNKIMRSLGD